MTTATQAPPHTPRPSCDGRNDGRRERETTGAAESAGDRQAKRQWMNAATALKQKVVAAEKLASSLPPEIKGELGSEHLVYEKELAKEKAALSSHCNAVKRMVSTVQGQAEHCQPDSDSIEALAELLERAENEIAAVKEHFRNDYNALMDEEDVLSRDLELFIGRMASPAWDEAPPMEASSSQKQAKPVMGPPPCARKASEHGTLLPEVVAFEEFRDEFGDYGNWHPEEHKEFLRILKICKYDYGDAVRVCCDRVLVGFERQDIIAHARWHQEYVDLEIRKRIALAEWKESRAMQKRALQESSAVNAQSVREAREVGEKKAAAERAWRENQKRALDEWHRVKAEEAAAQAEQERQRKEAELEAQAREMEYRLHQKALLEEHQLRKQLHAQQHQQLHEQDSVEQSASSAPAISPGQKQRIKERERQLQEKKSRLLHEKREAEEAREARQKELHQKVAPKIRVERDVGRLLAGTASTQRRARAAEEERAAGVGAGPGFIRNVQKLGVPSYMQR